MPTTTKHGGSISYRGKPPRSRALRNADSPLIQVGELADMMKVCTTTIRTWIRRGTLPKPLSQTTRTCYWSRQQIDRWLAGEKV